MPSIDWTNRGILKKDQFNCYSSTSLVYDIPSCVNSNVRLFADDCLLYRENKTIYTKLTCKEI